MESWMSQDDQSHNKRYNEFKDGRIMFKFSKHMCSSLRHPYGYNYLLAFDNFCSVDLNEFSATLFKPKAQMGEAVFSRRKGKMETLLH